MRSPNALMPFFWLVINQMARNRMASGVRVSWKTVLAVAET
jgi:hypothetical protein